MSRPIKIDTALYDNVAEIAEREGLSLKEALELRMSRDAARLREAIGKSEHLNETLVAKTRRVKQLIEEGRGQARSLRLLREERATLEEELQGRLEECGDLQGEIEDLEGVRAEWENAASQSGSEAERLRRQRNGLLTLALLIGAGYVMYRLCCVWRDRRRTEDPKPVQTEADVWWNLQGGF